MEPWQGQLLRKQYGRKDWPTLGSVPMTLTSVLVHFMEPLLGQSPSWPPRWLTLLIPQTGKSEPREVTVSGVFIAAGQVRQLPCVCWVPAGLRSHDPGVGGQAGGCTRQL